MRPLHDEHHGTTACHDIDSCPVSEPEFTASLLLDSGCLSKIKVIKTRDKPPVILTPRPVSPRAQGSQPPPTPRALTP